MLAAVLAGFVVSLAAPQVQRLAPARAGWILATLPLALFAYFASYLPAVAAGETFVVAHAWAPTLALALSFHLDGLGLLFALLITGIGALIVAYAGGYLAGHPQLARFYLYLLLFMASMLGLVLSDNLLALFVFWELTSLTSYLLIGFEHARSEARAAALQALLVTGGGGLALLAGVLLLGQAGGSLELSVLLQRGDVVRAHPLYVPALLLILGGAFTKSAQVPFHFWLPAAMEAPTPVSAYLHSATMVKAGVYLLARLSPTLGGTALWESIVTPVGAATMLVGAYLALRETDMKRILAYTTVSTLGSLTMLFGLGTPLAAGAAVVFLLGHALYKGALFMVAGAVDHETGTRDAERLAGLAHAMPVTAAAGMVATLSLAGFPLLLGFVGKELVYEAVLAAPRAATILTAIAVIANAFYVAAGAVAGLKPFVGRLPTTAHAPHEPPPALWLGPVALAGIGFVAGTLPALVAPLAAPAAGAVLGTAPALDLRLWHGLNVALALSGATLLGAVSLFVGRRAVREVSARLDLSPVLGPARVYAAALDGLAWVATAQTRVLQNGYLRTYVLTIVVAAVAITGVTLARAGGVPWPPVVEDLGVHDVALAGVMLGAAAMAATSTSRFGAVAALGVVGYGMALVFVQFGAPDLAITQVVVETLTVILFVIVFFHLPEFRRLAGDPTRIRDVAVAVTAGALLTALVLTANSVPSDPSVSRFLTDRSVPEAHGRNIVNVVLVDFRSLDTLGEIVVLVVAGLGVHALLRLRQPRRRGR